MFFVKKLKRRTRSAVRNTKKALVRSYAPARSRTAVTANQPIASSVGTGENSRKSTIGRNHGPAPKWIA